MKSIKVENCRTCPYIRHNDGGGFVAAFWKCSKFNIILIEQDIGIHNNLDEIHAQCQLDEYATGEPIRQASDILDKLLGIKFVGLIDGTEERWCLYRKFE